MTMRRLLALLVRLLRLLLHGDGRRPEVNRVRIRMSLHLRLLRLLLHGDRRQSMIDTRS